MYPNDFTYCFQWEHTVDVQDRLDGGVKTPTAALILISELGFQPSTQVSPNYPFVSLNAKALLKSVLLLS